jgi:hypothetical protein
MSDASSDDPKTPQAARKMLNAGKIRLVMARPSAARPVELRGNDRACANGLRRSGILTV